MKVLHMAKIAGMGYVAYKLMSYKAVKGLVKTALLAKGAAILKNKIVK